MARKGESASAPVSEKRWYDTFALSFIRDHNEPYGTSAQFGTYAGSEARGACLARP
jgi:hypothetical protein